MVDVRMLAQRTVLLTNLISLILLSGVIVAETREHLWDQE